jgi:hypothetical protein
MKPPGVSLYRIPENEVLERQFRSDLFQPHIFTLEFSKPFSLFRSEITVLQQSQLAGPGRLTSLHVDPS